MIDRLPRDSAYIEAVANDDVLAERIAARPEPPKTGPRITDWSPQVELLTALLDRVTELIQVIAIVNGGKPRTVPPAPRPVTAIERARRRQREEQHRSLVARLVPHRTPDPE